MTGTWSGLFVVARVVCVVAGVVWFFPAHAAGGPANVLVVYSQGRLLPANIQIDAGLNATDDRAGSGSDLRLFAEFLADPEFSGEAYEKEMANFLRHKYVGRPPRVLVGAGYIALGFLLRHRESMFPGVPIVFTGVDKNYLRKMGAMPPGVTGIPVGYDVGGTIDLAMQLQPDASRLVIVNGGGEWAQVREIEAREAIARRRLSIPVEYIANLGTEALLARLRDLPRESVIFTQGYFLDGDGRSSTPLESVQLMLGVSPAPIFTVYASQLGSGVVGGRMSSFADMGRQTRQVVEEVLQAGPEASNGIRPTLGAPAQLDWRTLQRWGIPMDRVPADAVIQFRKPGLWEQYRAQAITAVMVVLIQAGLIAALLLERRRRRHTARALEASEQHLSVATRAARLSTFVWDFSAGDGTGATTGQARHETKQEPQPQALIESIHPEDRDRVLQAARNTLDNAQELDVEFRTVEPGADARWIAVRGHAVEEGAQKIAGVTMDISERKIAELQAASDRAALTHLARVSTMGQLSAAIAHQLNQPLASILANAETAQKMLARDAPSTDELQEILSDIVAEDSRAADIIRHLAALYRRSPSTTMIFDLNDLVKETLELLRAEMTFRHTVIRFDPAANLPAIEGSRIQLQQVLLNFIINGVEAMADKDEWQRGLLIRTLPDGGGVRLEVVDRGRGIPQEAYRYLFDPFWSTKSHGLGVGLAICRTIIEAHLGSIGAAGNDEGGATFWFTVPATAQAPNGVA